MSQIAHALARRIGNLLARGTVAAVNAASKMQGLQLRLLAGEIKADVEHFEPYGFTSNPNAGAEAIAAFFDGDRSHGVVLVVADRRYRLKGLAAGEMAIHDDQGQKVHLTRSGIVIDGGGHTVTIQNAPLVTTDGNLHVNGSIVADGDISDHTSKSMLGMRNVFNAHRHAGGATPDSAM